MAHAAANPVRHWRHLMLAGALTVAFAGGGLGVWCWHSKVDPDHSPISFPLTPISSSPFLNTRPEVKFVGSEVCQACHQGDTMAYHRTGMAHSMARTVLEREPPDGSYDHTPSKRRYQVLRKDGQLWHREMLLTASAVGAQAGGEVVLSEFPVKYVVGSGRHSRTYLVETDGFLVESPVTWYTARKAWGMSPGYDNPHHAGFERAVGEGCLTCHAGRVEAIDGSLHKMRVHEAVISCERCHGPGELHIARHGPGQRADDHPIDYSIVNPRHLPRALAEAVCQQCHLRASATVVGRGRRLDDFRPGLPLQDFRQDYNLEVADRPMTVVGHVEQLHLSRCYQESGTLTCMTCHNPHGEPKPSQRDTHYNAVCASCHKPEACRVDPGLLAKQSAKNGCIECHMRTATTEIPHLAFTHHRIGIHDKQPAAPALVRPGLVKAFLDLSRLSTIDQKRSLGVGYLETANREQNPALADHYRRQADDLLTRVREAGVRDSALDASLARLRFDLRLSGVEKLAASALADPNLIGQDRCNALFLRADANVQKKEYQDASAVLLELTTLRRHAVDWLMLADCRQKLGNPGGAIAALEQAVCINPRQWKVHRHLAEQFRKQGDVNKADWHAARAVP